MSMLEPSRLLHIFSEGQIFKVIISDIQKENTAFKHCKWEVETPNKPRLCKKLDVLSFWQINLSSCTAQS